MANARSAMLQAAVSSACLLTAAAAPAQVDYLTAVRTPADFELVSVPSQREGDVERSTKFIVPARTDPGLLPTLFQNAGKYALHFEFLRAVFADRFPALEYEEYLRRVELRATREYYAGSLHRIRSTEGAPPQGGPGGVNVLYGFSVFTDQDDARELLTMAETRWVHDALAAAFELRPLLYAPDSFRARSAAREWRDPGFGIYFGPETRKAYEAYTPGVGYGRVRVLSLEGFREANERGRIGWQDILVIDRAPEDIEGVVAGVITGEEQEDLSHLAIRTARRGTPNAYLKGSRAAFSDLEGKLIRLEVKAAEYLAAEAPLDEAERWWTERRPRLSEEPSVDFEHASLDSLEEMDLSSAADARFGGKASNFARLQRILTGPFGRYRERGFGIPMRYYIEFLRSNLTQSPIDPGREVTYEEYIRELLAWDSFQSDAEVRFEALERFREEVEERGVVDPRLISLLAARIEEVFGSAARTVRFRSSSNIEDSLEFNGAGLYDSTSACAADDLDPDREGPSACDPSQPRERGIRRALKTVWASLWNFRAYEERAYYQIPQEKTAMGILVSAAFLDERANGVAFTGNPGNAFDRRYFITAQAGEAGVVSPDPGVLAERSILEVEDGVVTRIERARSSSLVPAGEVVMPEASLRELGAVLAHIDLNLPVELDSHERSEVLFDIEFKLTPAGSLAVKQVRPFLSAEPPAEGPVLALDVPLNAVACGAFLDARPPQGEYASKSQVRFAAGRHLLPTTRPYFDGRLLEEVLYGPERAAAESLGPGRFRLELLASGTGAVTYRFSYEESFSLREGGERLEIELRSLDFTVRPGEEPELVKTLSEDHITTKLVMLGEPGGDRDRLIRYSSCGYESLPRWSVHAEIDGGDVIDLEERFDPPFAGSGPADLVGAVLRLGGETREVRDYWRLVYSAQHHNVRVRYWVVLEPPLAMPGLSEPIHAIELAEPEPDRGIPARAGYLGPGFRVVSSPHVECYRKASFGEVLRCGFRRGDADVNGRVNITDAIALLIHLFAAGEPLACDDAADFNDDGILEITDALVILTYLFRGVDLSAPPGPRDCGNDPTLDGLRDCTGGCN